MTSAFIVNLDVDSVDAGSLSNLAEEIHAALDDQFNVVDVKPWTRPTEQPSIAPTTGASQPQPPVR